MLVKLMQANEVIGCFFLFVLIDAILSVMIPPIDLSIYIFCISVSLKFDGFTCILFAILKLNHIQKCAKNGLATLSVGHIMSLTL